MRVWRNRSPRFKNALLGLLLTAGVLVLWRVDPPALQRLDLLASDLRFRARGPLTPGPEVVIAAIDEKSIDQLGRWPWPYTTQAHLVDKLTAYGAAVIGYDVVFSESDRSAGIENIRAIQAALQASAQADPQLLDLVEVRLAEADHDRMFASALERSGNTILGYFFHWDERDVKHLNAKDRERFLENIRNSKYQAIIKRGNINLQDFPLPSAWAVESNIPALSQAAWGSGFFNNAADVDGALRRYPLIVKYRDYVDRPGEQDYLFAPLGIRTLERYVQGKTTFNISATGVDRVGILGKPPLQVPTNTKGEVLINHLGPGRTFPHYSVTDIIHGREDFAPRAAFRNKIVLVGATAEALKDLRVTPFDPVFPGVEIHATMIDNVLRDDFLVQPWWSEVYTLGSVILLGLVLTLLLARTNVLGISVWATLAIGGHLLGNYVLFAQYGLWLNVVYPFLATLAVPIGMMLYHLRHERQGRHYLRRVFGVYLPGPLMEQMELAQIEPELGGKSGLHTAYFTDITSFSSFSEVLSPTALVDLLLEYLTAMTDILQAEGGTLDKYEGDAIVAFFGAPVNLEDHASRAMRTALRMQHRLAELREKWTVEGDKWPELVKQMRMRIGMSAGEFVTGNMGSAQRMNYTMMGDVVNTAARLEASAKQYGIYIQCTTETLDLAGREDFECREIDRVKVFGKDQAVETVEIMAYKGELAPDQEHMRAIYNQGLALYRQQRWDEALAKFTASDTREDMFPKRPTNPSREYIERCKFFKDNPPGEDWDGSWTLTSK